MKRKYFLVILFLTLAIFLSSCNGIIPPTAIPSEAERFVGDWEVITPTKLSKVEIHSFGNNLNVHVWHKGNPDHPEDYDFGMQNYKIPDSFDGLIELHWDYFSNSSEDHTMEILSNGVLKVRITRTHDDDDFIYNYTDYFYNPQADNSFFPTISGMGLYQEDSVFVNLVYQLDNPQKICQYMEENFNYELQKGAYSPYQTYLSKEGDCAAHAIFANRIAHFHDYESNYVSIKLTNGYTHAIVIYDMGNHYTYSSNHLYFSQSFNSIEACVNHCISDFGYILSSYDLYEWDHYRNIIR